MNSHFQDLPIQEQAQIILKRGIYVSKSDYKNLEITLYRLEKEFVEIWYHPAQERIIKIEPASGKLINPYLKHLAVNFIN